MSDLPSASLLLEAIENSDPVAAAFDRMTRRMAALVAAIEGFAARQQEIHGRDYGPDLAKTRAAQERIRDAINILDKRPAMQMTVEGIAASIERAALTAREVDHRALTSAQGHLVASTQALERIVTGRIDLHKQRAWLAAAAGAILMIGIIIGDVVPPILDRAAPQDWFWPEARAASDLQLSGSEAGWRLVRVYDPSSWRWIIESEALLRDNTAVMTECRAGAKRKGRPVKCSISVGAPAS